MDLTAIHVGEKCLAYLITEKTTFPPMNFDLPYGEKLPGDVNRQPPPSQPFNAITIWDTGGRPYAHSQLVHYFLDPSIANTSSWYMQYWHDSDLQIVVSAENNPGYPTDIAVEATQAALSVSPDVAPAKKLGTSNGDTYYQIKSYSFPSSLPNASTMNTACFTDINKLKACVCVGSDVSMKSKHLSRVRLRFI